MQWTYSSIINRTKRREESRDGRGAGRVQWRGVWDTTLGFRILSETRLACLWHFGMRGIPYIYIYPAHHEVSAERVVPYVAFRPRELRPAGRFSRDDSLREV